MGRKNKRRKSSYSRKMKINPKKLIMRQQNTYDVTHSRSEAEHFRTDTFLFLNVATSGLWSWGAIRGQASRMDAVRLLS